MNIRYTFLLVTLLAVSSCTRDCGLHGDVDADAVIDAAFRAEVQWTCMCRAGVFPDMAYRGIEVCTESETSIARVAEYALSECMPLFDASYFGTVTLEDEDCVSVVLESPEDCTAARTFE